MNPNQDLLGITAFFSVMFHTAVILGISFKLPDLTETPNVDNNLDVVLVNSSNNKVANDAEMVSTVDNDGGGADDREASTPLEYKLIDPSPVQSVQLNAKHNQQTNVVADKLITQLESSVSITKHSEAETQLQVTEKTSGSDPISTRSARKLERERLIAKLSREWEDYQKRPKKEFVSPRTKKKQNARYLHDWKTRVERIGNANYPIEARARNLSGQLEVTVEINRNGTIASVSVTRPSAHKVLNDAALRIVRAASPYPSFYDEMNADTDILVITRLFSFQRDRVTSRGVNRR